MATAHCAHSGWSQPAARKAGAAVARSYGRDTEELRNSYGRATEGVKKRNISRAEENFRSRNGYGTVKKRNIYRAEENFRSRNGCEKVKKSNLSWCEKNLRQDHEN